MASNTIKWQVNLTEGLAMVMDTELNMVGQFKVDLDTNRSWDKIAPMVNLNRTMMPSSYILRRDHIILVTHTKRVVMAALEATVVLVLTTAVIILAMETRINIRINILRNKLMLRPNLIWPTASTIDTDLISTHTLCSKEMRTNQIRILLPVDILVKKTRTNYSNCTRVVESLVSRVLNSRIMDYKEQNHLTVMRTMLPLEVGTILGGLHLIGKEANFWNEKW